MTGGRIIVLVLQFTAIISVPYRSLVRAQQPYLSFFYTVEISFGKGVAKTGSHVHIASFGLLHQRRLEFDAWLKTLPFRSNLLILYISEKDFNGKRIEVSIAERFVKEGGFGGGRGRGGGGGRGRGRGFGGGMTDKL